MGRARARPRDPVRTEEELLDLWDDQAWSEEPDPVKSRYRVVLGEVPTDLLLAAKTHVDNLVREFTLSATGADTGTTAPLPPHVAALVDTVVTGFAEARQAIKRQAVEAARRGGAPVSPWSCSSRPMPPKQGWPTSTHWTRPMPTAAPPGC